MIDHPEDVPSPARMYDYFLGGFTNFAVDRQLAERVIARHPDAPLAAQANRRFLRRVVTVLIERGIDQFLDLGSGIPTAGNVHEVAQRLLPAARVVYVEKDVIAVALAEATLRASPQVGVIQDDLRHTAAILGHPTTQRLLDLQRPLAVLAVAVLHFIPDDGEVVATLAALREVVCPGSYLALSHATEDPPSPALGAPEARLYTRTDQPLTPRSLEQVRRFLAGWEVMAPGVVYTPCWRPEDASEPLLEAPERAAAYAGVGYKR